MQFNVGDRVVCQGTRSGARVEELATVLRSYKGDEGDDFVYVRFDKDEMELDMFSWRFILDDGLSPVCRKIRQMEKRFQNWQERKTHAMV